MMGKKQKNSLKPLVFPPTGNPECSVFVKRNFGMPKRYSLSNCIRHTKASILILALWSLCLLATFAVILGFEVRQKLTLVNRLDERDRLHFIAEAGIKKAISQIKEEPEKDYDVLKDDWSNNSIVFKEIDIGDGRYSISYDYINEHTGLTESWYGLIDEERKININKANQPILERLFGLPLISMRHKPKNWLLQLLIGEIAIASFLYLWVAQKTLIIEISNILTKQKMRISKS